MDSTRRCLCLKKDPRARASRTGRAWYQLRMLSKLSFRVDFYRKKLHGQEYYQSTTLQRLEVQRSAVSFLAPFLLTCKHQPRRLLISSHLSMCCGQMDNKVSFRVASAQTKLAPSSKREALSQRMFLILGTLFLHGALKSVPNFSASCAYTLSINTG